MTKSARVFGMASAQDFITHVIRECENAAEVSVRIKFGKGKGSYHKQGVLKFGDASILFVHNAGMAEYASLAYMVDSGYRGYYGMYLLATHEYAHAMQHTVPGGRNYRDVHNDCFIEQLNLIRDLVPFSKIAIQQDIPLDVNKYLPAEMGSWLQNRVSHHVCGRITWIARNLSTEWIDKIRSSFNAYPDFAATVSVPAFLADVEPQPKSGLTHTPVEFEIAEPQPPVVEQETEGRWMRVATAAKILGCRPQLIHAKVRKNQIEVREGSRGRLVNLDELE